MLNRINSSLRQSCGFGLTKPNKEKVHTFSEKSVLDWVGPFVKIQFYDLDDPQGLEWEEHQIQKVIIK